MKKIALYVGQGKPEGVSCAVYTATKLLEYGTECCACAELLQKFPYEIGKQLKIVEYDGFDNFADILMSFGGDGTMLSAARMMINSDLPIMGINVGKLGFLAEYSVADLDNSIDNLMKGNYRVVERAVLETNFHDEIIYALNDFVIEKKDSSRMITIECYSNEHYIGSLRADGMIITTPTGSTAYSLSCGGPILVPSAEVICLTPISPHSLTLRPLVMPNSNEITIKVHSPTGEANFVADGQVSRILKNNEKAVLRRSEAGVKLVKPLENSYYDLLRAKLLWAANAVETEKKSGGG